MFKALKSIFTRKPKEEVFEEVYMELIQEETPKEPVTKLCSFCKKCDHNIRHCDAMNSQLQQITDYCSSNQTNIPKTRAYLNTIDKRVIYRYVQSNKLYSYMYQNCQEYFNNNCKHGTKLKKYIEVIIGYLCVLPLNPQIKIKRKSTDKKTHITEIETPIHYNFNIPRPGVYLNSDGELSIGLRLL